VQQPEAAPVADPHAELSPRLSPLGQRAGLAVAKADGTRMVTPLVGEPQCGGVTVSRDASHPLG
jgi:hypothetical protein